jgi:hypothetical protein
MPSSDPSDEQPSEVETNGGKKNAVPVGDIRISLSIQEKLHRLPLLLHYAVVKWSPER